MFFYKVVKTCKFLSSGLFVVIFFIHSQIVLSATDVISKEDLELLNAQKVVTPPRSIADIVKMLDTAKIDYEAIKNNQARLEGAPPENASKNDLVLYHRQRVAAAEALGQYPLAYQECLKEREYADRNNYTQYADAMLSCYAVLFSLGNELQALELAKEGKKDAVTRKALAREYAWSVHLVNDYRMLGDMENAEIQMQNVNAILSLLKRSPSWSEWGDFFTYQGERAQGDFYLAVGKPAAAELSYIRAMRAIDVHVERVKRGEFKNSTRNVHNVRFNMRFKTTLHLLTGNSLLRQRKLSQAEYHYRESLKLAVDIDGKVSRRVAFALQSMALVLGEQGRSKESTLMAAYASDIIKATGQPINSISSLRSMQIYGGALLDNELYQEADQQFSKRREIIDSDPQLRNSLRIKGHIDEVVALLALKQADKALPMAQELYDRTSSTLGQDHHRTAFLQALLGLALNTLGKYQEAQVQFDKAMPIIVEKIRNDSENETSSHKLQKRFNLLIEGNIDNLFQAAGGPTTSVANEAAAKAFQLADIARGSSVQRAMTQSAARSSIKDLALEKLARQEQDFQRQSNSLNQILVSLAAAPPDKQLPGVQAKIKTDIEAMNTQRDKIKNEIKNRFPDYFELIEPQPITVAKTSKALKADEVLISWFFGESQSYVWAVHQTGLHSFATIATNRKEITRKVHELRKSLDPGVATADEIPPFDVALSHQLYELLLKPVEKSLEGKKLLISVPHAALGQLPLGTLLTAAMKQPMKGVSHFTAYQQSPWLIRQIAIAQYPSVNALLALRATPVTTANRKNFVGFGDPFFSMEQAKQFEKDQQKVTQTATRGVPIQLRNTPKTSGVDSAELALLPRLPETSIEIKEIARVLNAGPEDIFLYEKANVEQVMSMDLSNRKVVMFSTHGLVPGELNGLTQPALALSAPGVSGEKQGDGLLTMDKILELKLNADWVVLSACNTAAGEDMNAEAVSGLGRAFFFAGAKALLVSNWPVDSDAALQLMTDLFRRQSEIKDIGKAEALRQSAITMADTGGFKDLKSGKLAYTYAHPLFWAPFTMVGD
jgi:CHAT domain-containing protein